MSGIYSVEDLLKLRASPLICRPPNLPPIEEWMGTQETTNRRQTTTRGKPDEPPVQNEPFQKRPMLLDSQRRTSTDPDRIVLGPPRRSFASSNARAVGKAQEEDLGKKNGDWSETRHHERRNTQTNGRYGQREGEDLEFEGRFERRPKWALRDKNDQALEDDEDSSRAGLRRDRTKFSQPWFKKDTDAEENGRDDIAPDWRRSRREPDWDRQARVEAEPEWMDAAEPEEPFQARTQEDFQRWKEKMKAGTATPQEKVESTFAETAKPATTKLVSPEPDDSMDKFFAKFESKAAEQKTGTVKGHGKTRFASLFTPATEQNKQVEAPPSMPPTLPMPATERPSSAHFADSTADADQAGFARILEMLQTRSNNPTPQNQETTKTRTPLYARASEPRPDPEARPSSATLISLLTGQIPPQQQQQHSSTQGPSAQDHVADSRSPGEHPTHTRQQSSINKDEVLLNLLRQASLAPKPQPPNPHQQAGAMYGMPSDPNVRAAARNQMISPVPGPDPIMSQRRETGRSMFDESPVAMYQNEQLPREHLQRRATNGAPASLDDPLIALLRGQGPQRPMPPQSLPPGLQRPPGLEQGPRQTPNWPPQQPQAQPPRQSSLPPGLSGLPRGMPGAPYGQPQPIPSQQQPPQQQRTQQQPQRKYTGESSAVPGMPNLPSGMFPPPGFMNAGPPPGFPGSMANPPARFPGEPGPQGINRAFLEMYGEAGRGAGLRGGGANAGMPPFR